jgi:Skp family chaperone for outer membrane proteins
MKRTILTLFSALLLASVPLMAQTPAPQQAPAATAPAAPAVVGPAKIAWLNLEQAIFNSDEGKREFGVVQKFVEEKNGQLEARRKAVDTLRNQLQVQAAKLTDEARADLEQELETKETELQRFQQDTQKEIDNRRVKATNFVGRRMLPVIEKISKEKGLSAVVYINPSRDAWVDPSLIITEEVIRAYNAAYPATAAKTPAQAPATPAPPPAKKP